MTSSLFVSIGVTDRLWCWQWLLGKGLESIQELIPTPDNGATLLQASGTIERSEQLPAFPLDPNIGRYCGLLVTKPRVRNRDYAPKASAMAVIATRRSAAAMNRTGLLVRVLNLVGNLLQLLAEVLCLGCGISSYPHSMK
jgi:hypothetical protein